MLYLEKLKNEERTIGVRKLKRGLTVLSFQKAQKAREFCKKVAYTSNDTANCTAIANADQVKAIC